MTTKLYTAAEARRIDIERGGSGRVIQPNANDTNWHIFFHRETQTWRVCENVNGQLNHGVYHAPSLLVEQVWLPLTPEPEQEAISQEDADRLLTKSMAVEYARLRFSEQSLKQEKEQLEKELAESKAQYSKFFTENHDSIVTQRSQIEQLEKELAELKEKQRRKRCKDEKPEMGASIVYFNDFGRILTAGHYSPTGYRTVLPLGSGVELTDKEVAKWSWKYEADL